MNTFGNITLSNDKNNVSLNKSFGNSGNKNGSKNVEQIE